MTDSPKVALAELTSDDAIALEADDHAWYLYGITGRGALEAARAELGRDEGGESGLALSPDFAPNGSEPVQVLDCGDLAAIVRRVSLAEFGAEALRERLGDAARLEAAVRHHNAVIAAIHRVRPVLPAKFGCVYAHAQDLTAALERLHDALVAQIEWLAGCDEWAVHLYADREGIRERVLAQHAAVQRLQRELAAARPGRAYLLRRKLEDDLASVSQQALSDSGQAAYDRLARHAIAGQVNPPARPGPDAGREIEILRAAFLIRRASQDDFVAEVRSCTESREGLRCEYSGPWPPYSFAALADVAP